MDNGHHHFLDICGVAMGPLALALAERGIPISGSDSQWDPPIAPLLKTSKIELFQKKDIPRLVWDVDVWVAGTLAFTNPEIRKICEESGKPILRYPEIVERETRTAKHRIVVAGTKGKTTTTSMLVHIFRETGRDPDYLIGGCPGDGSPGIQPRGADTVILEGDEYPDDSDGTSPKFFHYHATDVILTNVQPDHVDRFSDFEFYRRLFRDLCKRLPPGGRCVVSGKQTDGVRDLVSGLSCEVYTVGCESECDFHIAGVAPLGEGIRFKLEDVPFEIPGYGLVNAMNAGLAAAMALGSGISLEQSASALAEFHPPESRLELKGSIGGIHLFVESCAHPHSLSSAVNSLAVRFPSARITVIVQPQFPGGSNDYVQQNLPAALASAYSVILAPIAGHAPEDFDPPFCTDKIIADLAGLGVKASFQETRSKIRAEMLVNLHEGDVVLLAVHNPSREILVKEIVSALHDKAQGSVTS